MGRVFISFILVFMICLTIPARAEIVEAPPGNRNLQQPKIPAGSFSRTLSGGSNFDAKYIKIRDLIAENRKLQKKIRASAIRFEIDPVHIVGALVGEHTYNVDALDFLQTYLVKAASYLKSGIEFEHDGESVLEFVNRPEFKRCHATADSYELWNCREKVWDRVFAGKQVADKQWPADRFGKVFFHPLYAGQTFGLGQLNPLSALGVTDYVASRTGRKKLDARQAPKVYEAIMDPDSTLDYMAAIIKLSIDSYRDIAGVDISANPGLTSTLYNLGDVINRARKLKAKRSIDPTTMPEENYYGWLVNEKLSELAGLIR